MAVTGITDTFIIDYFEKYFENIFYILGIRIFTMSTGDPPDFPLGKASTQSPAQQDMDRKLQTLTEEHMAHMQALTEAMEAQRLAILEGKSEPAVSTPEKSAGSASIGN